MNSIGQLFHVILRFNVGESHTCESIQILASFGLTTIHSSGKVGSASKKLQIRESSYSATRYKFHIQAANEQQNYHSDVLMQGYRPLQRTRVTFASKSKDHLRMHL